jgi:hypothetical protein
MNAIDTILDEHRSRAAVLHGVALPGAGDRQQEDGGRLQGDGRNGLLHRCISRALPSPEEDEYSGAIQSSAVRAIALTSRITT